MKYLIILSFLFSPVFAEDAKRDIKKISKKVEKRKGYCSPLDKMMNKCKTSKSETDKKILDKTQDKTKEISRKVEKRKGYCSPIEKMVSGCKNKKKK